MSSKKRRINRKIAQLVRMLEVMSRVRRVWPMDDRPERLAAQVFALGQALGRKGHRARAEAAIERSPAAVSCISK